MDKKQIDKKIDALANSERVTKSTLGELSRELLVYVVDTNDIATVNRLLAVLTPMNCKSAALFFRNFLPWDMPANDVVFGKKMKGKRTIEKRLKEIDEFLAVEDNTIWTWLSKEGIEPVKNPKNYSKKITNLIGKAMSDNEEGISPLQILTSIVNGGLTADMIINELDKVQIEQLKVAEIDHQLLTYMHHICQCGAYQPVTNWDLN